MSPSSPSTSCAPTTSIRIRLPPKARPTPPGGSTPRTVKVSMPCGVRRGSVAPVVTPSRAASASVTITLRGSTRKPSGSSTTCSPALTRWSVRMAWPSVTSAAKTERASPAIGGSAPKEGVVDAGDRAELLRDGLRERPRPPHLEGCRPGQVLDRVGERGERARVDDPDGDHERHPAGHPRRGQRGARALAPEVAAGEGERSHGAGSMVAEAELAPGRATLLRRGRMAVARVTEIIASSPDGFREAVEEGMARAARTLRGITGLEVLGKRVKVERGLIVEYRVDMKITFVLD